METLDRRLAAGMETLALPHTPEQRARMLAFLDLMRKWNRTYNLTAIRDLNTAVDLHLLDSLTAAPYLHGASVLDVGTGAGLPGIPLAILCPDKAFALLDSNAKKTRFVQQAVIELGLKNVDVITARVEQYRPERGFDTVLARAFASLAEIVAATARLLAPGGRILAQKGVWPQQEIETLKGRGVRVHKLAIPGLDVERHLVEIMAGS
ncbi:16S rRNA (guanine(527)-N(7))-methyltransferase RsmG [Methylomagnum ishizawai]|uniref:16S rRNA (guanine(527)-N(7))-methyltransferase RsmG n=1 Tax=Methylomagnum ishizawai TaxID=1760988 RepID=UPI001C320A5C|nr:16S rRNA (guanine(527)-N(7))-methyltransferase RsmG [Methylomagnum ishizawai]BBL72960.1 ribosomal RNA small subunit methyltransferase G [Methylomagnum ishizawai]